jgi:spore germination protein
MNGISDTIKFINQVDGYTTTLVKNDKLTEEDKKNLNDLYSSISEIKLKLNDLSREIVKGFSISANSVNVKEDYNEFTQLMQTTKSNDTDFPKMIYDGPFSDTVLNKEVKGLNFDEVSEAEVEKVAANSFAGSKLSKFGETNGKFATYDFNLTLDNGINCYAQYTKKGGKLLTLSCYTDKNAVNYTKEQAIEKAKDFASKQGVDGVECVWSDIVENDAYINLAPVVNDIIYYPDLIKVKVDLSSGQVIGWESTTYYTNHRDRILPKVVYTANQAKNGIDGSYNIDSIKLALSPIEDCNKEVLTHEIKCNKDNSIFYFYIDVETGETVNILKVIQTDNGNLLM